MIANICMIANIMQQMQDQAMNNAALQCTGESCLYACCRHDGHMLHHTCNLQLAESCNLQLAESADAPDWCVPPPTELLLPFPRPCPYLLL
jgi:hypothetical protein